ncbi:hypothetical protein GCM10007913_40590 [Devosia yakushimensis]|uniref:Glutaredoxin domain-containing protein n=1 Tax=Devosia yakushimensis TaxID=470028 RepID=A0ABQ5UJA9_9HYPH|nr:hypothetical protein [Devosia yakushimensis]GLQ12127.1 hypothetical protein GCM10007913_40590 [Devosia yakushimensis]
MTSGTFEPVVYLTENCLFSLKVRRFLLEAGLTSEVESHDFRAGTQQQEAIRAKLQPNLETVSFLAAQVEPDCYLMESDDIVTKRELSQLRGCPARVPQNTSLNVILPVVERRRTALTAIRLQSATVV